MSSRQTKLILTRHAKVRGSRCKKRGDGVGRRFESTRKDSTWRKKAMSSCFSIHVSAGRLVHCSRYSPCYPIHSTRALVRSHTSTILPLPGCRGHDTTKDQHVVVRPSCYRQMPYLLLLSVVGLTWWETWRANPAAA